MAEKADKFCADQLRRARVPWLAESRRYCLDCYRAERLKEDVMKKERKCKCGAELEKGKQKCAVCREGRPAGVKLSPPDVKPLPGDRNIITIDLSARPEIAMKIHTLARENFRTLDMQVLYMLHQEPERSGGK